MFEFGYPPTATGGGFGGRRQSHAARSIPALRSKRRRRSETDVRPKLDSGVLRRIDKKPRSFTMRCWETGMPEVTIRKAGLRDERLATSSPGPFAAILEIACRIAKRRRPLARDTVYRKRSQT